MLWYKRQNEKIIFSLFMELFLKLLHFAEPSSSKKKFWVCKEVQGLIRGFLLRCLLLQPNEAQSQNEITLHRKFAISNIEKYSAQKRVFLLLHFIRFSYILLHFVTFCYILSHPTTSGIPLVRDLRQYTFTSVTSCHFLSKIFQSFIPSVIYFQLT